MLITLTPENEAALRKRAAASKCEVSWLANRLIEWAILAEGGERSRERDEELDNVLKELERQLDSNRYNPY